MSITTGKMVGHIAPKGKGKGSTGLGRYSWMAFRGKDNITFRVVTFYKPCSPSGPGLVYTQHTNHFDSIGRDGYPRAELLKGLKEEIKKWGETGDQIVMMGDINKYIHLDSITKWAEEIGMRELITDKHGRDGPATTQGKGGQRAIDGIWGTA
eukprot:12711920-Ditylum_brightwellii.AAC.1